MSVVQSFGDILLDGHGNSLVINQVMRIAAAEIKTRPFTAQSPYIGLSRFEERHHQLFFGRDELLASLLEAVLANPFTLIAGASGSGKSSLVRAGLLPR